MTNNLARRGFLTSLGGLIVAPAIVKASNIMQINSALIPYKGIREFDAGRFFYYPLSQADKEMLAQYDALEKWAPILRSYETLKYKYDKQKQEVSFEIAHR